METARIREKGCVREVVMLDVAEAEWTYALVKFVAGRHADLFGPEDGGMLRGWRRVASDLERGERGALA